MPATYFVRDGIKFSVGESILVQSSPPELPYIARILGISGASSPNPKLTVCWYYRPEDKAITGGRKSFHGERELYASDHIDEIAAATVLSKCTVHTIEDYQNLDVVGPTDYYARFTFKVLTKEFLPPTVAVHCVCRMPENPDLDMVACDWCKEWFHPQCLNLTLEQAAQMSPFACPACQQQAAAAPQAHSLLPQMPSAYR